MIVCIPSMSQQGRRSIFQIEGGGGGNIQIFARRKIDNLVCLVVFLC